MKFLFLVASVILFTAKEDCKKKKGNTNTTISLVVIRADWK